MAWKNPQYKGPDIMVKLMRSTDYAWQIKSMRNGYLVSNGQYREQYQPTLKSERLLDLYRPLEADTGRFLTKPLYTSDYERELRNLHSQSSRVNHTGYDAPNSKYCSMTSSFKQLGWGEGLSPSISFRFDIWRSDVWKGNHDLSKDVTIALWFLANVLSKPQPMWKAIMSEQTPSDWDRGVEFEWLALGGTKIYNVEESLDQGQTWVPSVPSNPAAEVWYEAL